MTWLIGDVHGKYERYKKLIKQYPNSIQLGDIGIGFRSYPHGEWQINPPYDKMVQSKARFIRGNHDNPGVCRKHTQWIADGTVEADWMFVGGAYSIDCHMRIADYSWWHDEELSPEEQLKILEIYNRVKPRVMVTHDCPESIIPLIESHHKYFTTRTGQFFDRLFQQHHQPAIWVFGHHHKSFDQVIMGTRFICLAELEVKEII